MSSALKIARERRGWSLETVARSVGVSSAQVSRIETQGVKAAETAKAITDLFEGELSLESVCFIAAAKKPARSTGHREAQ